MPFTPTYKYDDIIAYVQSLVRGIPVSDISTAAVDQLDSIFWFAYPWRWTRGTLTAIPLANGVQDYAYTNADLWRLLSVRITNTTASPNQYRDLQITRWLEPLKQQNISWPNYQSICYNPNLDNFRLEATAAVPSGQTLQIDGEYKKQHTKITSTNSLITFPDFYFNVFAEGLLWLLYRFADDARAGGAEYVKGNVVYTGQMGLFFDMMMQAKDNEESGIGDTIYPDESLGSSGFGAGIPSMFNF